MDKYFQCVTPNASIKSPIPQLWNKQPTSLLQNENAYLRKKSPTLVYMGK